MRAFAARFARALGLVGCAIVVPCLSLACSSEGAAPAESTLPAPPDDSGVAIPTDAARSATPGAADAGDAGDDAAAKGTYRDSIAVCWADAKCPRVMAVAHGGDWTPTGAPYGSMTAITNAYKNGADGVKIDVRVTKDDVPVVSHSSPLQAYESLDCFDKRIESMTATEVTKCHFVKGGDTFQRLDTVLAYARGKMVLQLTVKEPGDYARAIAEVVARGAEDFAFFEVSTAELSGPIAAMPGAKQVFYLVDVGSNVADVDTLIALKNPRAFMVEMDSSPAAGALVASKIHPAGMRAFTYDSGAAASVAQLTDHFDRGFDVVSANATGNAVKARAATNTKRAVAPP